MTYFLICIFYKAVFYQKKKLFKKVSNQLIKNFFKFCFEEFKLKHVSVTTVTCNQPQLRNSIFKYLLIFVIIAECSDEEPASDAIISPV